MVNSRYVLWKKAPTVERLKDILSYDQTTGHFTWIKPPKNHPRMIGKSAGCPTTGYTQIKIDGTKYKAHQLAWLWSHGVFPKFDIDHADGNPFNNAIRNLRSCSNAQNLANSKRGPRKHDLPKGVRHTRDRFTARIGYNGKLYHIGTYLTVDEAASAYFAKATELFGEFARSDYGGK